MTEKELKDALQAMIEATTLLVKSWERGNLASAVNNLRELAEEYKGELKKGR